MLNYHINGEKEMDLNLYGYGFFYISLSILIFLLSFRLLRKIKNSPGVKPSFYEKEESFTFKTTQDFNVYFYTLGLLFLILLAFVLFFFLWVAANESLSLLSFFPLVFVTLLLGGGYFYAWKKGIFE